MKALVYQEPGIKKLEERPMPLLALPTDAIVKISRTTICGTDLHILKGDVASCAPGRILGHEGVGVVAEVGQGVTGFQAGDTVLISCISSCGKCGYCRRGMYSHCTTGGWILGNTIDGTQAEYVRIPHADTSLYKIPEGADSSSALSRRKTGCRHEVQASAADGCQVQPPQYRAGNIRICRRRRSEHDRA